MRHTEAINLRNKSLNSCESGRAQVCTHIRTPMCSEFLQPTRNKGHRRRRKFDELFPIMGPPSRITQTFLINLSIPNQWNFRAARWSFRETWNIHKSEGTTRVLGLYVGNLFLLLICLTWTVSCETVCTIFPAMFTKSTDGLMREVEKFSENISFFQFFHWTISRVLNAPGENV